jgi:hypothetical protein
VAAIALLVGLAGTELEGVAHGHQHLRSDLRLRRHADERSIALIVESEGTRRDRGVTVGVQAASVVEFTTGRRRRRRAERLQKAALRPSRA